MTAVVTYVRFGNLTTCISCDKQFRPQHPMLLVCNDCLANTGREVLQDTLKSIEVVEIDDWPDGAA